MVEWTDPDGHVAKTNSSGSGVALMLFIFNMLGQSQSHTMTMWSVIQEQGRQNPALDGYNSFGISVLPGRQYTSKENQIPGEGVFYPVG